MVAWLRSLLRRYGDFAVPFVGVCLLGYALWKRRGLALAVFIAALSATAILRVQNSGRELCVTFLNVGKGDAAVIETPSGKVIVVDTGGALQGGGDMAQKVILPFLRRRGIRRINTLLLTHPHADHIGGAMTLLKQVPVGMLIDNGISDNGGRAQRIRDLAASKGVAYRVVHRETTLDYRDEVSARVLAPAKDPPNAKLNDTSIVLRVTYRKACFLLTGDAEAASEAEMLATRQPLLCDVLKVGHHGSRESTTFDFLNAVRPRYAVISVDADNRQGYPHRETLQRLERRKVQTFRTDRNGSIRFRTNGDRFCIEPERP